MEVLVGALRVQQRGGDCHDGFVSGGTALPCLPFKPPNHLTPNDASLRCQTSACHPCHSCPSATCQPGLQLAGRFLKYSYHIARVSSWIEQRMRNAITKNIVFPGGWLCGTDGARGKQAACTALPWLPACPTLHIVHCGHHMFALAQARQGGARL
jgi:hypothetical protein